MWQNWRKFRKKATRHRTSEFRTVCAPDGFVLFGESERISGKIKNNERWIPNSRNSYGHQPADDADDFALPFDQHAPRNGTRRAISPDSSAQQAFYGPKGAWCHVDKHQLVKMGTCAHKNRRGGRQKWPSRVRKVVKNEVFGSYLVTYTFVLRKARVHSIHMIHGWIDV